MDAIVTAGGIPSPEDLLFSECGNASKALLSVAGKPMVQWVLDALAASGKVGRVIVAGLPTDTLLVYPHEMTILPDQGSMLDNLLAAAQVLLPSHQPDDFVLAVSSDIPTITAEQVDWMIEQVLQTSLDGVFGVIERQTMEGRFPGSRRTYLKLKDVELCGGDFNAVRLKLISGDHPLMRRIIDARKSPLKQAALMGIDTLLLIALRRLTLAQAAVKIGRKLGISVRPVVLPYAELGMDVDKPYQLELVRADLAGKA
jgi:GTP:adenosylcobinamide-phosphate guanylyltransferase